MERGTGAPPRDPRQPRQGERLRPTAGCWDTADGAGRWLGYAAPLPRPHPLPARPRRGPARPLRPLPRRHAQTQFLEKDGDSREAETRRAGEDRPLHPGRHAGGRDVRQSEG